MRKDNRNRVQNTHLAQSVSRHARPPRAFLC